MISNIYLSFILTRDYSYKRIKYIYLKKSNIYSIDLNAENLGDTHSALTSILNSSYSFI